MKLHMVLGLLVWASVSGAVETKTDTCDALAFKDVWYDLIAKEPRISQMLEDIRVWSGQPTGAVKMTNCRVTWPVTEDGRNLEGYRSVLIDKAWYEKVNGENKPRHAGMKIWYHVAMTNGAKKRSVVGMTFCRFPEICNELEIPHKAPSDKGFPTSSEVTEVKTIDGNPL